MANKSDVVRALLLKNVPAKEIARQAGCSVVYVYQVKHKAKKKMSQAFARDLKKIDKDLGVKFSKPSVIPSTQPDRKIHALLFVLGLAVGYIVLEIVGKL